MKGAVITTISSETPWAQATIPNTIKYCIRHGYSLFIINSPYKEILEISKIGLPLMDLCEFVWAIDSDVVITNHTKKIEDLELSDGLNICLEGLWEGSKLNCGSVIYKGEKGKKIMEIIATQKPLWEKMLFYWQQWLSEKTSNNNEISELCKIHPVGTFNSCHYNGKNNWQEGHFVYHPCGAWPGARIEMCKKAIEKVVE